MTDYIPNRTRGVTETREESRKHILTKTSPSWTETYAILLRPSAPCQTKPLLIGVMGVVREWRRAPESEAESRPGKPCPAMEVGYSLRYDCWGKGYASEAMSAFLALYWGLEARREVVRLFAETRPANAGSRNVLVKAGFVEQEPIARKDGDAQGKKKGSVIYMLERPSR